ncbi:MAG TPA: YraN family protein [Firmicutes bacterium]|nr:YraN family protein [Bacillota bacterium]
MTERNFDSTCSKGHWYEDLAEKYLQNLGYSTVDKNYRSGRYEIDLIMRKDKTLIFVEVKFRRSNAYGRPYEFLSKKQKLNIIKASVTFIRTRSDLRDYVYRFDVVSILEEGEIHHYPNAFSIDEFRFIKAL